MASATIRDEVQVDYSRLVLAVSGAIKHFEAMKEFHIFLRHLNFRTKAREGK
jgi:hypothetical protein